MMSAICDMLPEASFTPTMLSIAASRFRVAGSRFTPVRVELSGDGGRTYPIIRSGPANGRLHAEVVLNEAYNVVMVRSPERSGEIVTFKELFDDRRRDRGFGGGRGYSSGPREMHSATCASCGPSANSAARASAPMRYVRASFPRRSLL